MSAAHYEDCARRTMEAIVGFTRSDVNCRCDLEREREEDRAAIRDAEFLIGANLNSWSIWREKHKSAIQRATQAPGEGTK